MNGFGKQEEFECICELVRECSSYMTCRKKGAAIVAALKTIGVILMQIQTNSFGMKRNEYFWILARNYFKRRLWFYSLIYGFGALLVVSTVILKMELKPSYVFFIVFTLLLPIYYLLWFWRHSGSKGNEIFYRERVFTITDEFLKATLDDSSIDKIRWQNILYYKKIKEGYLLYISKQQFIYIPNSIFKSENEFKEFEVYISSKLKKVK